MIDESQITKMWAFAEEKNSRDGWGRIIDRLEGVLWIVGPELPKADLDRISNLAVEAFSKYREAL